MKLTIRAALLGALLLSSATAQAQTSARPPMGGRMQGGAAMRDPLGLSPAQRAKMQPIVAAMVKQMQAISADTKLSPTQKRARMMAIGERTNTRVMALLTPAQRKKAMQMRAQYMAQMRTRMNAGR